mmetsp:Transcript_46924/g.124708  ORF Transcript_46924/g.124708 Transcript_46924/m.124708 type:complete len:201 (+) Transcript_46924:726-1328(+)
MLTEQDGHLARRVSPICDEVRTIIGDRTAILSSGHLFTVHGALERNKATIPIPEDVMDLHRQLQCVTGLSEVQPLEGWQLASKCLRKIIARARPWGLVPVCSAAPYKIPKVCPNSSWILGLVRRLRRFIRPAVEMYPDSVVAPRSFHERDARCVARHSLDTLCVPMLASLFLHAPDHVQQQRLELIIIQRFQGSQQRVSI